MIIETIANISNPVISALALGSGVATSIYQSHLEKYRRVDDFLATTLTEKGVITPEDEEVAAQLLLIPQIRKRCVSISKTLKKADDLYEMWYGKNEAGNDVDDDWLSYYIDRASLVSDETIQQIWASILAQECHEAGAFRNRKNLS